MALTPVSAPGQSLLSMARASGRQFYLSLEVRKDGKLVSSPSLILQENSPGSLEIGSTNSSRFNASFKLAADASAEIRVEGEISLTAQGAAAGTEPMRMSLSKKVAPGAPFSESVAQQGSTVLLTGRVFPMPTAGDPAQVPGMQVSAQSALTCPGTQLGRLPALMRMLDENIQVNSVYRGDSAGTVRLVGTATSNARIAQLLGDLAKNPAFENARLVEVLRKDLGLNSYVLEVDPNCRPEVVAAAQAASAAAGANQRRVHIDFSMTDVNVPSLIKMLADVLGKKVEGLDALSAQRISIKAKRVNVEVLMRAALECVGYRLLQNEVVWLAEPDPARSSAADPSACLEESVRNNPGATQPLTVTDMPQPPLFAPGERLIADLKLHMGEGRTSNLYQPVMIGEVMRLNMRDGLALQCVVMVVARSPWLRCAEDQEGDPTMVRKAAVMSKIELGSPGTAIARTRAGEMKIEYSLSRKQA